MWRAKKENTYHMEYGFSNMGYEINASLGVKLACPDQEVYAFSWGRFLHDASFRASYIYSGGEENQHYTI
jgi:TPP-dependent trihydroxycyclohexane-1,2-dione (THcHDO) dehydratase